MPVAEQPRHQDDVARVGAEEREQERPGGEQRRSGEDHRAHAEPADEPVGEERDGAERAQHRQHPHPGLERAVAEDLLHQLRDVEDRREEDGGEEEDRQAGGDEAAVADHVAGHQRRRAHPRLDHGEGDERRERDGDHRQHPRVAPAPVGRLVERQQQRDEAEREGEDAAVVDPLALGVGRPAGGSWPRSPRRRRSRPGC